MKRALFYTCCLLILEFGTNWTFASTKDTPYTEPSCPSTTTSYTSPAKASMGCPAGMLPEVSEGSYFTVSTNPDRSRKCHSLAGALLTSLWSTHQTDLRSKCQAIAPVTSSYNFNDRTAEYIQVYVSICCQPRTFVEEAVFKKYRDCQKDKANLMCSKANCQYSDYEYSILKTFDSAPSALDSSSCNSLK